VTTVREAMTEDVLTITPGRTLRDAARFFSDHNVGAAVIIDPEQPGPGIITERDLVRSIGAGEDPDTELVRDHLTSRATFADGDWGLEEAADAMAQAASATSSSSPTARSRASSRCATSSRCGARSSRRLGSSAGAYRVVGAQ
jgi:CBS domain-containing protein